MTVQTLDKNVQATASATGTATFLFDAIPVSQTWTFTVTIPGAPDTTSTTAASGADLYGNFTGSNSWGPIQLGANDQLVLTSTGLIPGTQYIATITGVAHTVVEPPPVWPAAYADAVTTSTQQLFLSNPQPTYTAATLTYSTSSTITLQPQWRSIWVAIKWTGGASEALTIVGNQSGLTYATFQPPYFQNTNVTFYRVPVLNGVDTTVTLTASSNATFSIWYGADLAEIDVAIYPDAMTGITIANAFNTNTFGTITTIDPLYMVPSGGQQTLALNIATGSTNVLPVPTYGYQYRIHSLNKTSTFGAGLGVTFSAAGAPATANTFISTSITGLSGLSRMTITADGKYLYVWGTSTITVVNLATNTILTTISPSGVSATGFIAAIGSSYVWASYATGSGTFVAVINVTTNTIVSTINTTSISSSSGVNIAVHPSTTYAWLFVATGTSIYQYSTSSYSLTNTYSMPAGQSVATLNSEGNFDTAGLYFYVNATNGTYTGPIRIAVSAPSTLVAAYQTSTSTPNNAALFTYCSANGLLYYSGGAATNNVTVLTASTMTFVANITTSTSTTASATVINPNQQYVYVANATLGTNSIQVISTTTNTIVAIATSSGSLFGVGTAITPTGSYIYQSNSTVVSIMNVNQIVPFANLLDGATTGATAPTLLLNGRLINNSIYANNTSSAAANIEIGYDLVPLYPNPLPQT